MQNPNRFPAKQALLACGLLALAAATAHAQPSPQNSQKQEKDPKALSLFDPEDGMLDASDLLLNHKGALPVPALITEPAIGGGFRYLIARKLGVSIGIDVAHSRDQNAFYVQVGSAWH